MARKGLNVPMVAGGGRGGEAALDPAELATEMEAFWICPAQRGSHWAPVAAAHFRCGQ